jgi:hypothetical protein
MEKNDQKKKRKRKVKQIFYPLWTPLTALPDGSAICEKLLSQDRAVSVLHAMDGADGTVRAAASEGKCSEKMLR